MIRVAFIFGTRPEITKSAGAARILAQRFSARVVALCTGQQTDLVNETITDLEIDKYIPAVWLGDVALARHDPGWTCRTKEKFGSIIKAREITAVVGTGDTDSVLLCASLARASGVQFLHLEAGIRHAQPVLPLEPEERNRRAVSTIASLHLCPSARQRSNLVTEGIDREKIQIVGDLSCAAIAEVWKVRRSRKIIGEPGANEHNASRSTVCICTFHRSTSLQHIDELVWLLGELFCYTPRVLYVLCTRPDDRWNRLTGSLASLSNVRLVEAPPPTSFQELLTNADVVLTDSAGVQQEALYLNKPVVALRQNIELQADDPLLSVVRPPFYDLFSVFTSVLRARVEYEVGITATAQTGDSISEKGARMIYEFAVGATV